MIRINLLKKEKTGLDTKALLLQAKRIDVKAILSSDLILVVVPIVGAIAIGVELIIYANLKKEISSLEAEVQDLRLRKVALLKEIKPIKEKEKLLKQRIKELEIQISELDKTKKIYVEIAKSYTKFLNSLVALNNLQTAQAKITGVNLAMNLNSLSASIEVLSTDKRALEGFLSKVNEEFFISKPVVAINQKTRRRRGEEQGMVRLKQEFDPFGNKIFKLSMILNKDITGEDM